MITCILILIITITVGLWAINYESVFCKIEFLGYSVELNMLVILLLLSIIIFLLIALIRIILYVILRIYNVKLHFLQKEVDSFIAGNACLYFGEEREVKKYIKKLRGCDDKFNLLKACLCFKIGQYEKAEKYFTCLVSKNSLPDFLGLLLCSFVKREKDKYCQLQLLKKLNQIFIQQVWSVIFRIDAYCIEKKWNIVISELKYAIKFHLLLPYDAVKLLAVVSYAAADQCYRDEKYQEGLKILKYVKNKYILFIAILKAKLYIKIDKKKKALALLEYQYKIDAHKDIAMLYLNISNDKNQAIDMLYKLSPDYYFSKYLIIQKLINLRQYNAALQYLNDALGKYKYVSFYLLMIQLYLNFYDNKESLCYFEELKNAVPDMHWCCTICNNVVQEWYYECEHCQAFNSIKWI
ncbi:hypothetical protein HL033_01765 [Neoehrlichia mikurensis]|uniref:hypothetical protein n=1 Tax=Neoehrlichia mikurensis TaxID=89586 RepID=UPI001C44ECE4|nr:hypothetical protein [Neoehrlichia mikurensis]QXK92263.1 hypothetical protein IAH97_01760 [Neoehrlichia mikurensis]QXK92717.1 hypothetical protein HUN61_01755 [Neoehrlichia mikurensis]QXK93956.1 hypothetical protein HL033_01765 [Neoehrlichia mikurensis]